MQEIIALNAYLDWEYAIYYWRTRTQLEVDFVLYGERGLVAIEIKRAARIRNEDLKGLQAFREDYPMSKTYLLYLGTHRQHEGKIELLPIAEFFRNAKELL